MFTLEKSRKKAEDLVTSGLYKEAVEFAETLVSKWI
jgi:hypothetical protein